MMPGPSPGPDPPSTIPYDTTKGVKERVSDSNKKAPRVSSGGKVEGWICEPGGCFYGCPLLPGDNREA